MTYFNMSKTIHLAILDDEVLFRKGMVQVLQDVHNMELLYEANKGEELLKQLKGSLHKPDVMLVGLRGGNQKDLDNVHLLSSKHPACKIITLSSECTKQLLLSLLEMGVAACLPKHSTPIQVEHCINMVIEKGFFYNERVHEVMRENMINNVRKKASSANLSDREKEVLKLICEQYTNTEIADELSLSSRTVEWHRVNLLRKLRCKNTAGLVAIAIRRNLVEIDFSSFED